jgi:hypothetical protein
MVVALDKILPGEPFECLRAGFGVAGLGQGCGQVEAQRVGVVFAQELGHRHGRAPALAELSAFEVEAFMVTGDRTGSL